MAAFTCLEAYRIDTVRTSTTTTATRMSNPKKSNSFTFRQLMVWV